MSITKSPTFLKSGPILKVDSVSESIEFYETKLGFKTLFTYPDSKSPKYGAVERDGVEIHLAADGRPETPSRVFIWLETGIELLHGELSDKGLNVPPPVEEPWNGKLFEAEDIDGHKIQFLMRNS